MEATARLRHLRRSAQKVRLVADLIRMKPVEQALSILRTTPRVCAPDLAKLLESAVANAQQGGNQVDPDALVVASIQVDGAGKKLAPRSSQHMRRSVSNYKKKYAMPRLMSGPQGRVWFIARPLSHVTVVVSDDPAVRRKAGLSPEPPKPQARKKAAGRVAQAVSKAGARPAAKDAKTAKPKAPKAPKGEKSAKGGATPDAV